MLIEILELFSEKNANFILTAGTLKNSFCNFHKVLIPKISS